jgi:4-hydroxy-tetrahydrodipicolinate synthase
VTIEESNNSSLPALAGIYAASVTPMLQDGSIDLEAIPKYLEFLAERGCHGALLLGTTGEGPSFSSEERVAIWEVALAIREKQPEFRLLAATGTPSLSETIKLNKSAFQLGMDAVVVLPPFYFRNADDEGLFAWFEMVIEGSVPKGQYLLGYHIPQVSGVGLSFELLKKLNEAFPNRFAGLKDSSGDLTHTEELVKILPRKTILVGNDRVLGPALKAGAGGGITALANLRSPLLRKIWDEHLKGNDSSKLQDELSKSRSVMDANPSTQAFLKALLHQMHDFPNWNLRPPLTSFGLEDIESIKNQYKASLQ